jgi:monothiol glutaredoxin
VEGAVDQKAILKTIKSHITENDIVLFMKGTKEMPQCGFSSAVSKLLTDLQLPYMAVNVLDSPEIREGIKEYTDWPTIPQLYVKGEFVGGYDIVREAYEAGELEGLLKDKGLLSQN